ncbi:MAG: YegP family protein [Ignavibacteriaceae bacterium]|nr:YegP family protein [Ignavibacteriaceae bacterium]
MAGQFVIKRSTSNQFYFNLKAGNGEVILTSEQYVSKSGAENGINSVKSNAPYDANYERKKATNDQFYFVLKASNGQTIGKSELYKTSAGMENGIQSVKNNAPTAPTVDLT